MGLDLTKAENFLNSLQAKADQLIGEEGLKTDVTIRLAPSEYGKLFLTVLGAGALLYGISIVFKKYFP